MIKKITDTEINRVPSAIGRRRFKADDYNGLLANSQ